MDLGLHERCAAIGGSSAGLGFETARSLLAEGVSVAICGRDPQRLAAAAEQLGQGVIAIRADLSTPEGASDFVNEAIDRLGKVDILVANTGGPPSASAQNTTIEQYREAIEANMLSAISMCLEAVAPMRTRGWGRVLAITSIGVRQPIPFLAASVAARTGLTGFLKTLATEVAADGVTVNSIQPGSHLTDRLIGLHHNQLESLHADIPVGTVGDPADFGAVAAFLCSQQARFITGTSLLVDGGAAKGLL